MKKRFSREYLVPAIYVMLIIIFALLFIALCSNFPHILSELGKIVSAAKPIIYATVISLILLPLVRTFEKLSKKMFCRKKDHPALVRALGVTFAELVLLIIIAIIVVLMIPMINESYEIFSDSLASYIYYAQVWVKEHLVLSDWLEPYYDSLIQKIQNSIFESSIAISSLVPRVIAMAMNILSETWNVIIGIIISVYLLLSRSKIFGICRKITVALLPDSFSNAAISFITSVYTNFMEFFSSRLLDSLIVGSMCYVFCWACGIPFYSLISIIVFVANVIPIFGPIVGGLVGLLITLLVKPAMCVPLLIAFVFIHTIDRMFIEPRLLSKRLRLSVGAELILLLISYALGGVIGIIIATPAYVTLKSICAGFFDRRLKRRSMSSDVRDYYDLYPPDECISEQNQMDEEEIRRYHESHKKVSE